MSAGLPPKPELRLRLYIAGETTGARRARENRGKLIQALGGGIDIEVVDVLLSPEKAEAAGILATPTLSDESHNPPRRIVGDLSDLPRVFKFLGIPTRSGPNEQ